LKAFIVGRSTFEHLLLLLKNVEQLDSLVLLVLNPLFKHIRAVVVLHIRSFEYIFTVRALHIDLRAVIRQMLSQLLDPACLLKLALRKWAPVLDLRSPLALGHFVVQILDISIFSVVKSVSYLVDDCFFILSKLFLLVCLGVEGGHFSLLSDL